MPNVDVALRRSLSLTLFYKSLNYSIMSSFSQPTPPSWKDLYVLAARFLHPIKQLTRLSLNTLSCSGKSAADLLNKDYPLQGNQLEVKVGVLLLYSSFASLQRARKRRWPPPCA